MERFSQLHMKRRVWKVKPFLPEAKALAEKYGISAVFAQVLLNRNISPSEFDAFLNPSLKFLCSSQLLPDIQKGAWRIQKAVEQKEKILIFGDYDVDGITSLAIFHEYIKHFPALFSFRIPHRVEEGYGLNKGAVKEARKRGVSLLICFDCGTNAFEEIAFARACGIDVIVVDHHRPKHTSNGALAFINPKRDDTQYPFSDLSSAALSFKLLQVLKNAPCWEVLDLVALSLVCDVVPLKGENRILLKEGLKYLKQSERHSIRALCKVSSISQENIDTFHVGYILGPRINASGRVAHAQEALEMFLIEDREKVYAIANKLQEYNRKRREMESVLLKEAESYAQGFSDDPAIIVCGEGWHPGVLGIIASRLLERYYRPCFVIAFEDTIGKGSARSIHSVHLMELLEESSDYLLAWGGHKKAAGLEIHRDKVQGFREKINLLLKERLGPQDLIPIVEVDGVLEFSDITMELLGELAQLKPLGEEMNEALFLSAGIRKKGPPRRIGRSRGTTGSYVIWLCADNLTFEARFYDKDLWEILDYGETFDIVYALKRNAYHNSPQLSLKACRLSRAAHRV